MSSVYLACLVVGGGFSILSGIGALIARPGPAKWRSGPVFALRALLYSLTGFGAAGFLIGRLDPEMGDGLTLAFALLAAWLVGGLIVTLLTFLGRSDAGELGETAGGNRS